MKNKLSTLVAIACLLTVFAIAPIPRIVVHAEPTLNHIPMARTAEPVRFHEIVDVEESMPAGTVPWNVDMVDVETTSNDGEGIYVAVLDTGLLSNYLHFFPEDKVDIKEEWGIGFTHDVWYDPAGEGNWSI